MIKHNVFTGKELAVEPGGKFASAFLENVNFRQMHIMFKSKIKKPFQLSLTAYMGNEEKEFEVVEIEPEASYAKIITQINSDIYSLRLTVSKLPRKKYMSAPPCGLLTIVGYEDPQVE